MNTNDKKTKNLFLFWLTSCLILVFFIIIVGGLTRLTNSGLSITEWELFKGILPPLNPQSWNFYFDQYKKIPQFKLLNSSMSLEQFKIIFYWEYFHRLLARIIGLFFIIALAIKISRCCPYERRVKSRSARFVISSSSIKLSALSFCVTDAG